MASIRKPATPREWGQKNRGNSTWVTPNRIAMEPDTGEALIVFCEKHGIDYPIDGIRLLITRALQQEGLGVNVLAYDRRKMAREFRLWLNIELAHFFDDLHRRLEDLRKSEETALMTESPEDFPEDKESIP